MPYTKLNQEISELLKTTFDSGIYLANYDLSLITDGQHSYVQITHTAFTIVIENLITEDSFTFDQFPEDAIIEAIAQTAKAIAHRKLRGVM